MEEAVLTDEEQRTVEEGEAAGLLLENPAFLLAIERIRQDCAEGILTSKPQDGDVRENLYNLSRGLSAVTSQLCEMQSLAVSIIENARPTPEDEEVQDDSPDHLVDY